MYKPRVLMARVRYLYSYFFDSTLYRVFKQPLIFGILSREDLCLIHRFNFFILYTASTASELQGVKIQVL